MEQKSLEIIKTNLAEAHKHLTTLDGYLSLNKVEEEIFYILQNLYDILSKFVENNDTETDLEG